jgi:hypothetical protein
VTVGNSPSGTTATVTPTAKTIRRGHADEHRNSEESRSDADGHHCDNAR